MPSAGRFPRKVDVLVTYGLRCPILYKFDKVVLFLWYHIFYNAFFFSIKLTNLPLFVVTSLEKFDLTLYGIRRQSWKCFSFEQWPLTILQSQFPYCLWSLGWYWDNHTLPLPHCRWSSPKGYDTCMHTLRANIKIRHDKTMCIAYIVSYIHICIYMEVDLACISPVPNVLLNNH